MVQDGGHVLVDEASLWPKGQFVTTNLVVTQKFLAVATPTPAASDRWWRYAPEQAVNWRNFPKTDWQ